MTNSNNLDALFADAELPFGHPGRNIDDSPAGYSDFDDRYEPPPVDPPEVGIVHYGPGDRPLCGDESIYAVYTDEPDQVAETAWSLSLKTSKIRTPSTGATASIASIAAGRLPPPAPSSGAGWSAAHAPTADRLGGEQVHSTNNRSGNEQLRGPGRN